MRYVISKRGSVVMFSDNLSCSEVATALGWEDVQAAGRVRFYANRKDAPDVYCFGGDTSIGVSSRKEDAVLIAKINNHGL